MPQLDYDYDYLASFESSRKYNNSKKKLSNESARFNSKDEKYRKTSDKTKEQVRMFMQDGEAVKTRSSRKNTELSLPTGIIYKESNKKQKENKDVKNKKTFDYDSKEKSYFELEREYRLNRSFDFDMARKTNYNKSLQNKPQEVDLEETEEFIEQEKIAKKEAREKILRRFKNGVLFVLIAAVALFICYRYSVINEKFNSVEKAKKELLNAQTVNEQIQADIDSETDISYIENYAKYQLGMQKPQDVQIMYINVEKQDKIFAPVKIDEEANESSWFGKLMEKIANTF